MLVGAGWTQSNTRAQTHQGRRHCSASPSTSNLCEPESGIRARGRCAAGSSAGRPQARQAEEWHQPVLQRHPRPENLLAHLLLLPGDGGCLSPPGWSPDTPTPWLQLPAGQASQEASLGPCVPAVTAPDTVTLQGSGSHSWSSGADGARSSAGAAPRKGVGTACQRGRTQLFQKAKC